MPREQQWLGFVCAFRFLATSTRPLRICLDSYFPTEEDFGILPVLFPYVERIGLVLPSHDAAAIYRKTLRDNGWDKVVPVVEGDQYTGYCDLIVTRW